MKRKIQVWDYAGDILNAVGKGVLLTTKADGRVNTMTIGWGTLGIEWGQPLFTAFVRESRYTRELLEKNPEFTINVPVGSVNREILSVCGRNSGRDMDKIEKMGLTLVEPEVISVPGIRQLPLTLECRVVYSQLQEAGAIAPELDRKCYAKGTPNEGDYHIAYYGQILSAYIIEED